MKDGLHPDRTVVPYRAFPSALMPQGAGSPLIIAESFDGTASVGIACRNFNRLFNNNDPILRCIHSEAFPIDALAPGETALQEGVVLLFAGDHEALAQYWEAFIAPQWR
jgi:hypothetical protein